MGVFNKLFGSARGGSKPFNVKSLKGRKVESLVAGASDAELNALITIAKANFSPEIIGFVFAVHQYRRKASHQVFIIPPALHEMNVLIPPQYWGGANTMGKWIYDKYIDDAAAMQINLPGAVKTKLDGIARSRSHPFIPPDYDAAFREMGSLVEGNWLNQL